MKKLFALFLVFLSSSASASYLKECGTGHVLAGGAAGGYLAVSINISSSTSDASTSRLSTPELCGKSLWAAAKFINLNLPMIEQDTAMGSGEHMTAMLDILECDMSARPNIINSVRNDYTNQIKDGEYSSLSHNAKVEKYFNIVNSIATQYQSSCSAV